MSGHLTALPVEIGERFAERYVVSHIVGGGGMSVVVGARHDHLDQLMAVKFLAVPSELRREGVQRFFQEARAAASLRSEHIVRVTDAGTDEKGRHFIAMELLDGSDLAQVLNDKGPLPIADAVGFILHACEGIAEAHAAGIVHRDLKPANLFATRRIDGSPLVKVLDFGISKIANVRDQTGDQLLSHPESVLGTPRYMSPEQLRTPAEVDGRTDVWALGVMLLELLTGENPFAAPTAPEIFAAILADREAPSAEALRPEVPRALSEVIARCLRKDPTLRTPSAGALAAELLPWSPPWAHEAGDRAARICQSESHRPATPAPSPAETVASPALADQAPPRAKAARRSVRSLRGGLVLGFTGTLVLGAVLMLRASSGSRTDQREAVVPIAPAPPSPSSIAPAAPPQAVGGAGEGSRPPEAPAGAAEAIAPTPAEPPLRAKPEARRPRPKAKTRRPIREASEATGSARSAPSRDPLEGRE